MTVISRRRRVTSPRCLPISQRLASSTSSPKGRAAISCASSQTCDSTLGLDRTGALHNLHVNGLLSPILSLPAASVFDDRTLYYDPANPQGSAKNPNTGTQIRVLNTSAFGEFMQIQVRPAK